MMKLTARITQVFVTLALLGAPAFASHSEGDVCEISGFDFFQPGNKTIVSRVAGTPGCSIDLKTNCFCGPDYENPGISQWIWACDTQFGPVEGKTCPAEAPYEKGFVGETPDCDTAINPTGEANDWACGYSDCDAGGDESVICGCVDLALYGIGTGQKWFCIHSTCQCETDDGAETPPETPTSASVRVLMMGSSLAVAAMLALASL